MKKETASFMDEKKTIELSSRIDKHDQDAILEALQNGSCFCKAKAMVVCAKYDIKSNNIIEAIRKLKGVDAEMCGNTLDEYAQATLHVLGVDKYTGNSPFILTLIENGV